MLSKDFVQAQKKLLQERKLEIERELKKVGHPTEDGGWAPNYSNWTGDAATDNVGDDWGVDPEEKMAYEVNIDLLKNLLTTKGQVEKALEKIAAGTYGICDDCAKEINIERLKVVPEATTCLDCTK